MDLGDAAPPAQATAIGTVLLIDDRDLTRRSMARLLNASSSLAGLEVVEAATVDEAATHAGKPVRVVVINPDGDGTTLPATLRALKAQGGSLASAPVAVVLRGGHGGLPGGILDLGVRGCIGPSVGGEDLVTALRLIIGGAVFIAPGMLTGDEPKEAAAPAAATLRRDQETAPPRPTPPCSALSLAPVRLRTMQRPVSGPALTADLRPHAGSCAMPPPAQVASSTFLRPAPPPVETALTARETQVLLRLREGKPNKIIAHEMGISENTVKVHVRRILRKLRAANRTEAASFEDVEMTPTAADQRRYALAPSGVPILRPLLPSS